MALAFLQELLQRFFTKSPLFFRIWQWISATAAIITGIPPLLVQWGITLPAPWDIASNKFIAALTTGMWVMSRLTTHAHSRAISPCLSPELIGVSLEVNIREAQDS